MTFSKPFFILLIFLAIVFQSCDSQKKKDASDFFLKGNVALTQKNYAEAIRLYDEAIDKNPEFSDAYLNKGISLMRLGKVQDAYEVLTHAIKLDPTLTQANLIRSEAALLLGLINEAELDLKTIEKEFKDSSRYYLIRGNFQEAKGQPSLSLADYDKAITLDPANVEAWINRGAIYYKQGSIPAAQKDFETALKIRPNQTEALNNLGLIAIHNHKPEEALALYDQILNINPADALALNNKGYALLQLKRWPEAEKVISRSLETEPKNGYALRNIGIYYQKIGNLEQSKSAFEKAIDLAEPVEDLYGLTGELYLQMKDQPAACKTWQQGITLKDNLATTLFNKYCK